MERMVGRDVLENGLASPYAAYFDIDWQSPEERLRNKILLPILGGQYGRALKRHEIVLGAPWRGIYGSLS